MNGWASFVSMQNYYNQAYREEEREMLPLCEDQGIAVIPWSPMARGFLVRDPGTNSLRASTDDFMRTLDIGKPADIAVRDAVTVVAERHGVPRAHVAVAWLLGKSAVTAPIVGASKDHHLKDAVAALDLTLSDEDIGELEAPYQAQRLAGHG
jgi:aryl-alcohol dehydrogenase-like predicted oxidoreductase